MNRLYLRIIRLIGWACETGGVLIAAGAFRNVLSYYKYQSAKPILATEVSMALDTAICVLATGWLIFFIGVSMNLMIKLLNGNIYKRLTINQVKLMIGLAGAISTILAALIQFFKK